MLCDKAQMRVIFSFYKIDKNLCVLFAGGVCAVYAIQIHVVTIIRKSILIKNDNIL